MKIIIILALVMMGYVHTAKGGLLTTLGAIFAENNKYEDPQMLVVRSGLDEVLLVYGGENPENLYKYQAAVNAYETLNEVDLSDLSHDEVAYEIIHFVR